MNAQQALVNAIDELNLDKMRDALANGADANMASHGMLPLHQLAQTIYRGYKRPLAMTPHVSDMAALLIQEGADPLLKIEDLPSPQESLLQKGDAFCVELAELIEANYQEKRLRGDLAHQVKPKARRV